MQRGPPLYSLQQSVTPFLLEQSAVASLGSSSLGVKKWSGATRQSCFTS